MILLSWAIASLLPPASPTHPSPNTLHIKRWKGQCTSSNARTRERHATRSTIADLIHHVRAKLSIEQISKAVAFFTRNMYDTTLSLNIQIMSAKLLVHLVETVFKMTQSSQGSGAGNTSAPIGGAFKTMLINIMQGFVAKFEALHNVYPGLAQVCPLGTCQRVHHTHIHQSPQVQTGRRGNARHKERG